MPRKRRERRERRRERERDEPSPTPARNDLAALFERDEVRIPGGTYAGGMVIRNRPGLRVTCEGSVLIRGGTSALKFERCDDLRIAGHLILTSAELYGLMVVESAGLLVEGVEAVENGKTGILTANVSDAVICGNDCSRNVAEHGIYASQSGDRIRIVNNLCAANGRCGIQVNAVQKAGSDERHDGISRDVELLNNRLHGNQVRDGGSAINLAGVHLGRVLGNRIEEHCGRYAVAMWDDGRGEPRFACHDVGISDNAFGFKPGAPSRGCVLIGKGCSGIHVGANGFPDGVPRVVNE